MGWQVLANVVFSGTYGVKIFFERSTGTAQRIVEKGEKP